MKLALAVLVAAALGSPVRAEGQAPAKGGWYSYFKNFKDALAQSAVSGQRKKARGGAASVAAVRGAGQSGAECEANDDLDAPGIKGSAKCEKARVAKRLDGQLMKLGQLVEDGKGAEALKGFEDFKAKYPKHQPEMVNEAIINVRQMLAEGGSAAQEGAVAEQPKKASVASVRGSPQEPAPAEEKAAEPAKE